MNILPKKRWHVRTRENIARVRKDEAKAAEEEKERIRKIEVAEKEARTAILRARAREQFGRTKTDDESEPQVKEEKNCEATNKHVNLFYEMDDNDVVSNKTNREHEEEKKLEREKYEKQIGYLTYLGQDTNELTGNVSWYNRLHKDTGEKWEDGKIEVCGKEKRRLDPLEDMKKYLSVKKVKMESTTVVSSSPSKTSNGEKSSSHKKRKKEKHSKHGKEKHSKHEKKKKAKKKRKRDLDSDNDEIKVKKELPANLQKLRDERIKREQEEKQRAALLLARLRGEPVPAPQKEPVKQVVVQKYNSQFNPHLAKQNFDN